MLAALTTAVLAAASAVGAELPEPCWQHAANGARFRTCFDPGRGLELSAGGSARSLNPALDLGLGLRLRGARDSRSKAGTTWLLQHRLLGADARWSKAERHLTLTAYEGLARRHVDEGFLLLPTTPPIRLPFPLDLGLYGRAARYERRVEDGLGWSFETARLAMLFDPLRSATGRFHQIGRAHV